jgi:hypothetical protein
VDRHALALITALALTASCGTNETDTAPAATLTPAVLDFAPGVLRFRSGFEPNVYIHGNSEDIRGSDGMDFQSDLEGQPEVDRFILNMIGRSPDYAYAEIRPDPVKGGNRCLYFQLNDDDPDMSGMTRAQCSWYFKTTGDAVFQRAYLRYRVYWLPDLAELRQYPNAITWFTFMELWEDHNSALDGDPAGQCRFTLSFNKDAGADLPLYWAISAEYMQPASVKFKDIWPVRTNRSIPIPFGRWATLEILFIRGQSASGRILLAVTPDGGARQVVFDIQDATEYPQTPLPFHAWNVWKLYTSDTQLDWMRSRGKIVGAYYDDFEWWSGGNL